MLWFRLAGSPRQIMEDRELSDNPAIEFLLNRLKSGGEFTRGQLIGDEMLGMKLLLLCPPCVSRMQFKGWLVVREGDEAEEAIAEQLKRLAFERDELVRRMMPWPLPPRYMVVGAGTDSPTMPAEFSIAPFNPVDPPPERPDVTPAEEPQPTQPLALAAAS